MAEAPNVAIYDTPMMQVGPFPPCLTLLLVGLPLHFLASRCLPVPRGGGLRDDRHASAGAVCVLLETRERATLPPAGWQS